MLRNQVFALRAALPTHAASVILQGQQSPPAQQTLCDVQPTDELAQGLGEELGRSEVLLRRLPRTIQSPAWLSAYATWSSCSATS